MKNDTARLLESVLRSDDTVSAVERNRLLKSEDIGGVPQDRIVRRAEAAVLLGRGVKGVDRLANRGVLKKVMFPTCKKGAGFRLSDIANLISGGKAEQH